MFSAIPGECEKLFPSDLQVRRNKAILECQCADVLDVLRSDESADMWYNPRATNMLWLMFR